MAPGALLVVIYANRPEQVDAKVPDLVPLSGDIFLASQLTPEHMQPLRNEGIRSVIDIRPDGEAVGQPSSNELSVASIQRGMEFHYVPVPHQTIPEEAVDALRDPQTEEYVRQLWSEQTTAMLPAPTRSTGANIVSAASNHRDQTDDRTF